jgi:flagellar export protein FliJ
MPKSRFAPLVKMKKHEVQKCEQNLQQNQINLQSAQEKLEQSLHELTTITPPTSGTINDFRSTQLLLTAQRMIIQKSSDWVEFAKNEILTSKELLKLATIEFEKFQYLEMEEIKEMIKAIKLKEAKDLDEVALQAFMNKKGKNEIK